MARLRVCLVGAAERPPCPRLLAALSTAYEVDFELAAEPAAGAAGLVVLDGGEAAERWSGPALVYGPASASGARAGTVDLADCEDLDAPFRGACLAEEGLPATDGLPVGSEDRALAVADGTVFWTATGTGSAVRQRVLTPFPDLPPDRLLRDIFRPGRFLALLPLVQFLARLRRAQGWRGPELRAAILIDDPNLHATRYGRIDFPSLVRHAASHDYHVAFATVPLDGWYAAGAAVRLFREHADRLSLLIHGNDHVRLELEPPRPEADYREVVAQALRRIDRFAVKTGLPVARVMAAPHGRCAETAAVALHRTGYEALCISRPYPWLPEPPRDRILAGWFPAEHVVGGLPVLPRYKIADDPADLRFRAWLGQPLVVYGHHGDAAGGYVRFAEVADRINGYGPVRWMPLQDIAGSNVEVRAAGKTLEVRAFSVSFAVDAPDGTTRLSISTPPVAGTPEPHRLVVDGVPAGRLEIAPDGGLVSEAMTVRGGARIGVKIVPESAVDYRTVVAPRRGPWPRLRRLLTEARDRVLGPYRS